MSGYYREPLRGVLRAFLPASVWRRGAEGSAGRKQAAVLLASPAAAAQKALPGLRRRGASRQAELLAVLIAREKGPEREQPLFLSAAPMPIAAARAAARALGERGFAKRLQVCPEPDEIAPANAAHEAKTQPHRLGDEQARALEVIQEALRAEERGEGPARPTLLFGVTGSGKTEVYLRAIERVLERGGGAIALAPEISLTPQTAGRIRARFADLREGVAVLHSGLSPALRAKEWRRAWSGRARVVAGPRSALFAPVRRLRLIVVDEEHDGSYKQESPPRYQARDCAVMRARIEGAACVLGGATPSLESWKNAAEGKYALARLTRRVDGRSLPLVRVVDLRREPRKPGADPAEAMFSEPLREALSACLARGEQAMLLINRRGWARCLRCAGCEGVLRCESCSVAMVHHRAGGRRLLCHHCGAEREPPSACPECGRSGLMRAGAGSQRVERALARLFPRARAERVDSDSMGSAAELEAALGRFLRRETDVLVGTQMIAKGLHFPGVTLVGALRADLGLSLPDFRAAERVFQLAVQMAGRAGRGSREGTVIMQSFAPHAPALVCARRQDFPAFAEEEMEGRRQMGFPPFARCALLAASCEREGPALEFLGRLRERILSDPNARGAILGPAAPAPIPRLRGRWRAHLLARAGSARALRAALDPALDALSPPRGVRLAVDMDPASLL